jgi:hypothetical protein
MTEKQRHWPPYPYVKDDESYRRDYEDGAGESPDDHDQPASTDKEVSAS